MGREDMNPSKSVRASRRGLLAAGFGTIATALMTGCTLPLSDGPLSDGPSKDPSPEPTPTPTPTLPGARSAAELELGLAGRAEQLRMAVGRDDAKLYPILTAVAAGHRAHWIALSAPLPTSRPTDSPTPTPTPTPPPPTPTPSATKVSAGLKRLVTQQGTTVNQLTDQANQADAVTSLFWASMAAATASYAHALKHPAKQAATPKPSPHRPVEPVTATEATRAMIGQLHAIGYGYQRAIGFLEDDQFDRATTSLRNHRSLRDRLIAGLVEQSVEVPPAAAAYDVPVEPKDAGSAAKLIMTMETGLLPFCGQWVAAAETEEDRELAIAALRSTAVSSVGWGGPLLTWPGYVDQ